MLGNFACFCCHRLLTFQYYIFQTFLSGTLHVTGNVLSVLIWVQTVCKGYQQRTKVTAGKERVWIQLRTEVYWLFKINLSKTLHVTDCQTAWIQIRPDLGPNSLQRLSTENKSCSWKGKSLDPDQDRPSVAPELGQNSLQRLSAEDKSYRWKGKRLNPDQDQRSAVLSVLIWVQTVCKG